MARFASKLFVSALVLAACTGDRDLREPGEKLGTFIVQGKLVSTTCGKADPSLRYEVRLSREADRLYWVQGATPISGTIDAESRVRLEARAQSKVVAADEVTGSPGCTMERVDTLAAKLEGEPIRGFSGAVVYRFDVVAGDCVSELASQGGDYAALPCTMTYEVAAAVRGAAEGRGLEGAVGTKGHRE